MDSIRSINRLYVIYWFDCKNFEDIIFDFCFFLFCGILKMLGVENIVFFLS